MAGWVKISLEKMGKSSQNKVLHAITPVCIVSVCTLLNVVSHYDLCFLTMSVMGFQETQSLDGGGLY